MTDAQPPQAAYLASSSVWRQVIIEGMARGGVPWWLPWFYPPGRPSDSPRVGGRLPAPSGSKTEPLLSPGQTLQYLEQGRE